MARHGIPAGEVLQLVQAIGSIHLGEVVEGQLRFPLVARLPAAILTDPDRLADTPILAASGELLPLDSMMHIESTQEPLPNAFRPSWPVWSVLNHCSLAMSQHQRAIGAHLHNQ